MANIIKELEKEQVRTDLPKLEIGDTVRVFVKVIEGSRERLQNFEGIVIKIQGGGENYVHGGVSMQEMVVPVIIYKGIRANSKNYVEVKNPGLLIISESRKVSNLMFSLDFLQKQPVGDKVQPCNYTLHFTDEVGAPVSDFQTVIADRTSGKDTERVFRVSP